MVDAELVELAVGDVEEVADTQVPLREHGLTALAAPAPRSAQDVPQDKERARRGAGQRVEDDVDLGGGPFVGQVLCPGPYGLGRVRQREVGEEAERFGAGPAAQLRAGRRRCSGGGHRLRPGSLGAAAGTGR
ncbi:hypothetical protein [Streptomyces sp. NPDC048623]|uniref:hypothetical protein n=1 Tax=Streptomyces sp. NPDC048623 TaxID=3155761 RepID=UPI0034152A90